MGRGIKAGKKSKDLKTRQKIKRLIRTYEAEERKKFVNNVRANISDEITETIMYQHNIDMLSVMFALRDEFNFGKNRLIRTIKKASSHAEFMHREKVSVDEMLAILEEETGVSEEDLIFKDEIIAEDDE